MHDQHDDTDEEENPGDLRSNRCDPEEAEGAGYQPNQEKDQRVIEHCRVLLAEADWQLSCQLPQIAET
jgi:hypothetical protein